MQRFFRLIFWPSNYFGTAARFLGALSVLALIKYAFGAVLVFPFSIFVGDILNIYDELIGVLLNWVEPYVQHLVKWILSYFGFELDLYPHWKHVTVLVGIYLSRSIWISFRNNAATGVFRLLESLVLAPLAGILSGFVPLSDSSWVSNFLLGFYPILALFLYGVINGGYMSMFRKKVEIGRRPNLDKRRKIFLGHTRAAWRRTWIGSLLLAVGVTVMLFLEAPRPGLIMAGVLVFIFALYHLQEGRAQAIRDEREYWQTDGAQLGGSMVGVILWDGVLIVVDRLLGYFGG